jgi:hypothetical protein
MQLKNTVFLAIVALLKVLAETYLPNFPISVELINTVLLALLALVGVDVVEFAARKTRFAANFK